MTQFHAQYISLFPETIQTHTVITYIYIHGQLFQPL